jgi:hypothetical protein
MAGVTKRLAGPVALANAAGNIYNQGSALIYTVIRHISIVNKTAASHNFSLFVGATGGSAAGTEVVGSAKVIAANDVFNWYGMLRLDSTDFLTGLADAAASLSITVEGDINVI